MPGKSSTECQRLAVTFPFPLPGISGCLLATGKMGSREGLDLRGLLLLRRAETAGKQLASGSKTHITTHTETAGSPSASGTEIPSQCRGPWVPSPVRTPRSSSSICSYTEGLSSIPACIRGLWGQNSIATEETHP